jgi:three-Cys-motif partner protein
MVRQSFGGDWTTSKLRCLDKYLRAYTRALSKQNFETWYIDSFAGTGWLTLKQTEEEEKKNIVAESQGSLFNLIEKPKSKESLDGSARLALKVSPSFNKYFFIEKSPTRFNELKKLETEFSDKEILFSNSDANIYLRELCESRNWIKEGVRAVLFLDPYGLNVSWETLKIIAETQAIDLWYLFPFGIGLNRLLTVDGNIKPSHRLIIDNVLGESDWYDAFYKTNTYSNLFESGILTEKNADFETIRQYLIGRLKTLFPGVADNPKLLYNNKKNPLYLLCFASANPKGAKLAIKIAQDVLRTEETSEYKLKYRVD